MQEPRPLNICIATYEFLEFHKPGGIGTANTGLALALSRAGHNVTVALPVDPNHPSFKHCSSFYHRISTIKVVAIPLAAGVDRLPADPSERLSDTPRQSSYCFHAWLTSQQFDVVNTDDYGALGFYSIMAKKVGLAHNNTAFICQVHGPRDWILDAQSQTFNGLVDACSIDTERFVIEKSDHTVFVSQYLFHYLQSKGLELDLSRCSVQPYISPYWNLDEKLDPALDVNVRTAYTPKSIVFFAGRQEERKGFQLFLETIDNIQGLPTCPDIHIIGQYSRNPSGVHSGLQLLTHLKKWQNRVFVHYDLDSKSAIKKIQAVHGLVIMPSLTDNLPNTVLECIEHKLPFITTNTGGQAELIVSEQHKDYLFDPHPRILAKAIHEKLSTDSPPSAARYAISMQKTVNWWYDLFSRLSSESHDVEHLALIDLPEITVGIVHFNQPYLVRQVLDSLLNQTHRKFRIIICDDGSTNIEALKFLQQLESSGYFEDIPVQVIRNQNTYLGAARNSILANVSTDYVVFMDDDNFAHPRQLEILTRSILLSGAGAITLFAIRHMLPTSPISKHPDHALGKIIGYPIGYAPLSSHFENMFGDANAIYSVAALKAVSGFFEERGIPYEDWNCFHKLFHSGYPIYTVPLPLYWYRVRAGSMLRSTSPSKPIALLGFQSGHLVKKPWIHAYVHSAAMHSFVHRLVDGRYAQRLHFESLQSNKQFSDLPLFGLSDDEQKLKLPVMITELLARRNSVTILTSPATLSHSSSRHPSPISPDLVMPSALRTDLVAQSNSESILFEFAAAKSLYSVACNELLLDFDCIHITSYLDLDLAWHSVIIDDKGIMVHPHKHSVNTISFPKLIPAFAKFIKIGLYIPANIGCNHSAEVRAGMHPSSSFSINQLSKDDDSYPTSCWSSVAPNGKEHHVYLSTDIIPQLLASKELIPFSLFVQVNKMPIPDFCHLRISSMEVMA